MKKISKLMLALLATMMMTLAMGISVFGASSSYKSVEVKTDVLKKGESTANVSIQTFTVEVDPEDGKGGAILFNAKFEKKGTWVIEMTMSEPMKVVIGEDGGFVAQKTYRYTEEITSDYHLESGYIFGITNSDFTSPVTVQIKSYLYEYEKPGKVKLSSVKNVKGKKAKVTWKKIKGVKGYEIVCGTNKKCTKGKKTVTASASSKSKTIKKLKIGKTYYFKIRAYKVVGETKLYGAWSKVKKVKIKK